MRRLLPNSERGANLLGWCLFLHLPVKLKTQALTNLIGKSSDHSATRSFLPGGYVGGLVLHPNQNHEGQVPYGFVLVSSLLSKPNFTQLVWQSLVQGCCQVCYFLTGIHLETTRCQ